MPDRIDTASDEQRLVVGALRAMVRQLGPSTCSAADAVALVDWFAEVERLAVAGKALAARVAAAGGAWRGAGDRSAADWLAKRTGTTVGEARCVLETAERLAPSAPADEAFRRGELSLKQAEAVAAAVTVDPAAATALLDTAQHRSLQKLRDESARVRAAAECDAGARHERIRRSRYWRRWTDVDGARCGAYRMTPEAAALVEAAAQPFIDEAIDTARRTGEHEAFDAYAADGLVAMAVATTTRVPASGAPPRGGRGRRRLRDRRELIALVDLEALQAGAAAPGGTCEIAGVGPVPVDVVRRLFGDALLRIVVRDGADVKTVVHTGRAASAVQETAVLVQQDGCCGIPYCDQPATEIDHGAGFRVSGPVALGDLIGACGHHHDQKTNHGYTWRRDPDHSIVWVHPDGTEERQRPPP